MRNEEVEIWKNVKDPVFEDYYQVSNLGRLRTKDRWVTRGGANNRYTYRACSKIVSVRRSQQNPHLFASLYAGSHLTNRTKYLHKLVAEAFLKRPSEEHIFVTHLDENYDNNTVGNLKWITASENSKKNIEKYPENKMKLKKSNDESGYYESLKLEIWKKKNSRKILKMRKWGVSVKEIARIYTCSEASIYSLIRKNNK
jgi:hypothetical protein